MIAFAPLAALVALLWVTLLVVTPTLPAAFGGIIYAFGSLICHQMPERSFHLDGAQLPVCARCLGIYAGAAAGALLCVPQATLASLAAQPARRLRLLLLIAGIPTIATVAIEGGGLWHTSNLARAGAGVVLGAGVALVVMGAAATLHYEQCARRRSSVPPSTLT